MLAGLLYLVLVDAAVETFLAGAPVRWIVVGAVAAYSALSILLRRKLTLGVSASASLLVLLGLLAFSAWRPGGMSAGVVLLRQPTSTVLAAVTALAILLAGWILVRLKFVPVAGKAVLGLLTLYGVAAVAWGVVARTPYPDLFHGQSLWTRLPFWLQGAFIGGLVVLPAGVVLRAVGAIAGMQGRQRRTDALRLRVFTAPPSPTLKPTMSKCHPEVRGRFRGDPDPIELTSVTSVPGLPGGPAQSHRWHAERRPPLTRGRSQPPG